MRIDNPRYSRIEYGLYIVEYDLYGHDDKRLARIRAISDGKDEISSAESLIRAIVFTMMEDAIGFFPLVMSEIMGRDDTQPQVKRIIRCRSEESGPSVFVNTAWQIIPHGTKDPGLFVNSERAFKRGTNWQKVLDEKPHDFYPTRLDIGNALIDLILERYSPEEALGLLEEIIRRMNHRPQW